MPVWHEQRYEHEFPPGWWDWDVVRRVFEYFARRCTFHEVSIAFKGGTAKGYSFRQAFHDLPQHGKDAPLNAVVKMGGAVEGWVGFMAWTPGGGAKLEATLKATTEEAVLGLREAFKASLERGDFERPDPPSPPPHEAPSPPVPPPPSTPWWRPDMHAVRDNLLANVVWWLVPLILAGLAALWALLAR